MDIQKAIEQFTPTSRRLDEVRTEAGRLHRDIYELEKEQLKQKHNVGASLRDLRFDQLQKSEAALKEVEQSIEVLKAHLKDVEDEAEQLNTTAKEISDTLMENAVTIQEQFNEQYSHTIKLHADLMIAVNALHETNKLLIRRTNAAKAIGEKVGHTSETRVVIEPMWKVLQNLQVRVKDV